MNTIQMYDAQVDTIKMEEISNDDNNRDILHRIKRNSDQENNELYIQHQREEVRVGETCVEYVPEGAYDMGWLGYFVGKNEHLEELNFGWDEEGEWTLKGLPYVVAWFEKARGAVNVSTYIERRKLLAIYEFAKAMPLQFAASSSIKAGDKKRKSIGK